MSCKPRSGVNSSQLSWRSLRHTWSLFVNMQLHITCSCTDVLLNLADNGLKNETTCQVETSAKKREATSGRPQYDALRRLCLYTCHKFLTQHLEDIEQFMSGQYCRAGAPPLFPDILFLWFSVPPSQGEWWDALHVPALPCHPSTSEDSLWLTGPLATRRA